MTLRRRWTAVVFLLSTALFAPSGCRKSHVEGTVSAEAVAQAFADLGYDAGDVKKIDPDEWAAGYCSQGSISGLAILVCEFETDEALAKADQRFHEQWNVKNVETAVVARNGRTLLSIVDEQKADPNGRAIVKLLGAFRGLR